jgi:hypothetical protein
MHVVFTFPRETTVLLIRARGKSFVVVLLQRIMKPKKVAATHM